ncbi:MULTISPECIES: hypothetical protein [Vibrio]|uniref:hypothetical protein n=1 Tax=Vibrio TaxID=662 RepID=UPI000D363737|nr:MULTISPECIES: hypothetical protein [Vibrio]PTO69915.1 hypothetical protein CWN81_16605 [Vibrio splendidus]
MDNSVKAMLVERAKARRLNRLDPDSDWNEIVQLVENQPRLRHFVYCLYTGHHYKLDDINMLDHRNRPIAFFILDHIHPENPFGDICDYEKAN